jgi:hypothetical protein
MTKKNESYDPDLGRVAAEIEKATQRAQRYRKMDHWLPYAKQAEFFALTALHREVALFAGTQLGKNEAAAFMMAVNHIS